MRDIFIELLKEEKAKGKTIFMSSHIFQEVEEVCDRVLFMNKGRLIAEGTPSEIKTRFGEQTLERVFIKVARGGDLVTAPEERP